MGNLRSPAGSNGSTSQEVKRSDGNNEDELSNAGVGDSGILEFLLYVHSRWNPES